VDKSKALSLLLQSILHRGPNEPLGTLLRDGLDTESRSSRETDLLVELEGLEPCKQLLALLAACLELDTGVNVFGVLTENNHVDVLGALHRAGDTLEVSHGAKAHVEIELLSESDVQGADTTADGGGQGSLDTDKVLAESIKSLSRKPVTLSTESLLTSKDLKPRNLPLALVSLLDGSVEHAHGRLPNITASAVALDERDDLQGVRKKKDKIRCRQPSHLPMKALLLIEPLEEFVGRVPVGAP
jgi:hypothetical protein